jgi:hypothetical protein
MCYMLPPQKSKVFFYQLTSCSRIFIMKLIILYSLWRNILPVIIPKLSLPCAQELAVQPYPEPDKNNPQLHTLLFKDYWILFFCSCTYLQKWFYLQVLWQKFLYTLDTFCAHKHSSPITSLFIRLSWKYLVKEFATKFTAYSIWRSVMMVCY